MRHPKISRLTHPGDGYWYTTCAICDRKLRAKDAILISDRYNTLYNQVVCVQDYEATNPQSYPFYPRAERALRSRMVRPSPIEPPLVTNENSYQAPSAPLNVYPVASPFGDGINIFWTAPEIPGSDPITGYKIVRASPQSTVETVIIENTLSNATFYLDTTVDLTNEYSYRIAAINAAGTGPYSAEGYYPTYIPSNYNYLASEDPNTVLATGDGSLIILTGS